MGGSNSSINILKDKSRVSLTQRCTSRSHVCSEVRPTEFSRAFCQMSLHCTFSGGRVVLIENLVLYVHVQPFTINPFLYPFLSHSWINILLKCHWIVWNIMELLPCWSQRMRMWFPERQVQSSLFSSLYLFLQAQFNLNKEADHRLLALFCTCFYCYCQWESHHCTSKHRDNWLRILFIQGRVVAILPKM